ncbi:RNA polymerase sigma factor [Sphingomonadaceae bacterium LXI357]|uniref:RNA polymerase sigma factor n=1 Tax=Stakelama marina TaxID=2826939 RepID=A0A8T4IAZ0_9SPHN|nr:RNA polymerase sigma factor [Stakelama marina]
MEGLAGALAAHRPELLRFLTARTGDGALAEDLMQEMWLRVREGRPVSIGNPRAYLYRMAQNLVLDRLKEERRRMARDLQWSSSRTDEHGADLDRSDPEKQMIEDERVARFTAAIAALPPATGRAFRLNKIDGLGQAEVAASMGISRSGVEKHIARAMVHLRRSLAGED